MSRTPHTQRRSTPAVAVLCALVAALLVLMSTTSADGAAVLRATGFGAHFGGDPVAGAALGSGERPVTSHHGPASGAVGSVGSVRVELAPGRDSVVGIVSATGVTLAAGRVSIASVSANAIASTGDGATGLAGLNVQGLTVDGVARSAGAGGAIEIAGVGRLVFGEQVAADGELRVNAVRLEVTDAASGLPVGTAAVIGHLRLSASTAPEPLPQEAVSPDPGLPADRPAERPAPTEGPREVAPLPEPELAPTEEGTRSLPPATPTAVGLPRRAAPPVTLPSDGSYAFPVTTDYGYIDDYGAPRAVTGWHHGNDIFAPTGTPVVAVASGTLSKVGWNTLGGNRLWLTDDRGNEFYYAHLSAYAPSTVNGARVRAGEVIGFIGNSGQAITTPPHLHFEIHPGGGDSVNPYPYLLAWERGAGVALAFRAAEVAQGQAPASGAVLVEITPDAGVPGPEDDSGLARVAG